MYSSKQSVLTSQHFATISCEISLNSKGTADRCNEDDVASAEFRHYEFLSHHYSKLIIKSGTRLAGWLTVWQTDCCVFISNSTTKISWRKSFHSSNYNINLVFHVKLLLQNRLMMNSFFSLCSMWYIQIVSYSKYIIVSLIFLILRNNWQFVKGRICLSQCWKSCQNNYATIVDYEIH